MINNCRPDEPIIEVLLARSDIEVRNWLNKAIACEEKKSSDEINLQHQLTIGFDIEWVPIHKVSDIPITKVSLIQMSTTNSTLLIQMKYYTNEDSQATLIEIMNSERILKVGVGILQDLQRLESDYGIPFRNYCELSCAAKRMNETIVEIGLASLANNYFGLDIEKVKSVTMSNWDREELNESQIQYAVYDALMGRQVYEHLASQGAFHPERMADRVADILQTFENYYLQKNEYDINCYDGLFIPRSFFYDVYMKCAESDW
eukprot:CAMPEP_0119051586 /NCGR_PEP_ID=MMETSP1177-20130426/73154_1 /TAXON_ID=2985 /ORGANISM="Ochromonas sp, Strain CCMP1899" /LENGTH=260 /DNA_ID=CAMNT_0007030841 /DNA_START=260 /DNA_END=1039 /DNA_ORIENTATION=+